MLFQPSNISPSTFSGIGASVVDVLQGLTVSWQVNGDTPMLAYQITILQNDSTSTFMYSTGKITLSTPFQTHDKNGAPQFFSTQISAATLSSCGIVNGYANGYKTVIKQWWGDTDADSVEQSSASVFFTKATPTLSIDTISANSISTTITATYSQAQGDSVSTVEWIFAVAGSESSPIEQTGAITTQILSFDANGLMSGTTYSIRCNVVTSSGFLVSDYKTFSVSYSVTSENINFIIGKINGSNGVYVSWGPMSGNGITTYDVYRKEDGVPYLKRVASVISTTTEVVDYSVASNQTASYVIIGKNGTTPVSMAESQSITPVFWDYSILLCYSDDSGDYHVDSEYRFSLGVETGSVSNNNEPTLQTNFTPYPTRQPISTLYKTGSVKGYIGSSNSLNQYSNDTVSLQNAIFEISKSTMTKFLKTRKGEVLMIETSSSINMQITDASPLQPLMATINWVEVGSSNNISILSLPSDQFWPMTGGRSIYTVSFYVDNSTGQLMVNASDNLNQEAQFSVGTSDGQLITTESNSLFSEIAFYVSSDNMTLEVKRK